MRIVRGILSRPPIFLEKVCFQSEPLIVEMESQDENSHTILIERILVEDPDPGRQPNGIFADTSKLKGHIHRF